MNELFKIDMDKREIVLNYKHYNVNVDILNYIVDLLKQLETYKNMRKELLELILFYFPALDQRESNFKDELLNILNKVGEDNE